MLQLPFPTHLALAEPAFVRPDPLRLLDLIFSAVLLTVLSPIMALIAFAVWAGDGGAPFYRQQRIGRGGGVFGCLKFRTMTIRAERGLAVLLAADPHARSAWQLHRKLGTDPRVTPLGRLLRRSSFDELPQLFNVLIGDMSLVGPRPIVAGEVSRYGRCFADYCARRPGLTGLWQVSGRSRAGYARRLACDRLFDRRCSLRLYLRILLATVPAVLTAHGAC